MEQMINAQEILIGKHEGKKTTWKKQV